MLARALLLWSTSSAIKDSKELFSVKLASTFVVELSPENSYHQDIMNLHAGRLNSQVRQFVIIDEIHLKKGEFQEKQSQTW